MKSLRYLHTSLSQQSQYPLSWVCKAAALGPCQFSVVVVVSNEETRMSPCISITAVAMSTILGYSHTKQILTRDSIPVHDCRESSVVKIAKFILKKNQDPSLGLLEYRSTPLENGYSPAELLMGRKLRTTLPIAPENLTLNDPYKRIRS
ncbi:K02A2.6-like [Cordylochernes scorpioides]|uniref:K02A2.6-like n=1 Tax=Cordylochernes scorpioides TaxID=51811 RepID=A0ABY6LNN6_9ARAC|nr:K02A2.6-like [Cordylochernes scorpioides]